MADPPLHLSALVDRPLLWTQPRLFHEAYQLQDADTVLGTLDFRSALGTLATAKNGAGCWTFKRLGFLQTRVNVRRCETDDDLAIFRNTTWSGGGTLELSGGRTFTVAVNFWHTRFEVADAGHPLVRYRTDGFIRMTGQMEILSPITAPAELPWIVMLGWYLAVMMYRDSSAMAIV